jgi:hypothetical protein
LFSSRRMRRDKNEEKHPPFRRRGCSDWLPFIVGLYSHKKRRRKVKGKGQFKILRVFIIVVSRLPSGAPRSGRPSDVIDRTFPTWTCARATLVQMRIYTVNKRQKTLLHFPFFFFLKKKKNIICSCGWRRSVLYFRALVRHVRINKPSNKNSKTWFKRNNSFIYLRVYTKKQSSITRHELT